MFPSTVLPPHGASRRLIVAPSEVPGVTWHLQSFSTTSGLDVYISHVSSMAAQEFYSVNVPPHVGILRFENLQSASYSDLTRLQKTGMSRPEEACK